MKILFLGKYNPAEVLTGPEKVAKRLFERTRKVYPNTLFVEYFFKGYASSNIFTRIFGFMQVQNGVYRLGLLPLLILLLLRQYDVIHIATFERFVKSVFWVKVFLKSKVVYTVHGIVKHEKKPPDFASLNLPPFPPRRTGKKGAYKNVSNRNHAKDYRLEELIFAKADKIIFISQLQYELSLNYYDTEQKRIFFIPNGVDECFYRKRQSFAIDNTLNVVFYAGFTDEIERSVQEVIDIIGSITFFKVHLYVITNEKVVTLPTNTTHISVIPPMQADELVVWLKKKHIILKGPSFDSFSIFTVECMASGLIPVISGNVGCKAFIEAGKNGFIYKKEHLFEMKDILSDIATKQHDLLSLSHNASGIYHWLSWDNVAGQYHTVYKELI